MIQYNKIIQTFGTGKIEDFFVCNCIFDDLLIFISSSEKISYNDITSKLVEEKRPNGFLFLKFYDTSILICKNSFEYYKKIRKDNFVSEKCCPEILKINGKFIPVCLICFMKDIVSNLHLNFFEHFRLVDQFRSNGLFIYMQLPIRTYDENLFS